jgi:hypothetical protein
MNKIAIRLFERKIGTSFEQVIKAVEASGGIESIAIELLKSQK